MAGIAIVLLQDLSVQSEKCLYLLYGVARLKKGPKSP